MKHFSTPVEMRIDILPQKERRKRDLLALVERIRAEILADRITDLFFCAGREDGFSAHAIWKDQFHLIGVLAIAQHDAIARVVEDDEDDDGKDDGGEIA